MYSTNPYRRYVEPSSREFITLSNNAITNFKSEKVFALDLESSEAFTEHMVSLSKKFGYHGLINRVPTDCDIDGTNANLITYRDHKNFIDTWQEITEDIVERNSTQIWGDKSWTITDDKQIAPISQARGEVETGVRGALNDAGKRIYMM